MMSYPKVFRKRLANGGKSSTYYFRFTGPEGLRHTKSCRTSDRRAAEKIRNSYIERIEAIARGDISPDKERQIAETRRRVSEHVAEYISSCQAVGQDAKSLKEKERHLKWFVGICESFNPPWRLDSIRADVVDERLGWLTADGKSARTINIRLESMCAFLHWCTQRGRMDRHPLRVLKKRNETMDRRHMHRVLSEDETTALLATSREMEAKGGTGRWLWYALALYAGLRRGDLVRMKWLDLDLDKGTITIRGGKARHRVDVLPLGTELVRELRRVRPRNALPSACVFPRPVHNSIRQRDYERAGIVRENDYGIADLHSLRATFATRMAARGVAPAVLQRLMRHCTPQLTMKYYVHLDVETLRAALEDPKHSPLEEEVG